MATEGRREWTPAEDEKVREHVGTVGNKSWKIVGDKIGRTATSCSKRWYQVLNPDLERGPPSPEEDAMLWDAYGIYGTKSAEIAKYCNSKRSHMWIYDRVTSLKKRRELRIMESIDVARATSPAPEPSRSQIGIGEIVPQHILSPLDTAGPSNPEPSRSQIGIGEIVPQHILSPLDTAGPSNPRILEAANIPPLPMPVTRNNLYFGDVEGIDDSTDDDDDKVFEDFMKLGIK